MLAVQQPGQSEPDAAGTLSEARSQLYRRRSLQVNSHFAALIFFQDLQDFHNSAPLESQNFRKFRQKFRDFEKNLKILQKFIKRLTFRDFEKKQIFCCC